MELIVSFDNLVDRYDIHPVYKYILIFMRTAMTSLINLQRRNLLKYAAIGIASAATYPVWSQAIEFKLVNKPSADFHPDVEIELTQSTADISIFKGEKTRVWKVTGKLLKGPSELVDNNEGTYLAATLRLKKVKRSD